MAGRHPGTPKTGGRKKGVPNKATTEFREAVTRVLEDNASNYGKWLKQVAEGYGRGKAAVAPDPAKALDLVAKLAEYAAPKLNRVEMEHSGSIEVASKEQRDAAVAAAMSADN
jgi:hypothetical protein